MTYTESCSLNLLYFIKDAINTIQINVDFQPTKILMVSYNIQEIGFPLQVIFALHGRSTVILIHQCPKTNLTINTVGYYKSCSFSLACLNDSSQPFAILDHSTCARKELSKTCFSTLIFQFDISKLTIGRTN